MNCERFRDALVGDDPVERGELERHAATCADCAALLEEDRDLERRVAGWKDSFPDPPGELRRRIAAAIVAERTARRTPARRSRTWWAAAAAVVLLAAAGWLWRGAGDPGADSEFERALSHAEDVRLQYARAIADLERSAEPLLARAGDPGLPPEDAARLLSYRERLTHLDGVIAEVQGFLETHPGHTGGNAILLAAYTEKQAVLGEILRTGETS